MFIYYYFIILFQLHKIKYFKIHIINLFPGYFSTVHFLLNFIKSYLHFPTFLYLLSPSFLFLYFFLTLSLSLLFSFSFHDFFQRHSFSFFLSSYFSSSSSSLIKSISLSCSTYSFNSFFIKSAYPGNHSLNAISNLLLPFNFPLSNFPIPLILPTPLIYMFTNKNLSTFFLPPFLIYA